MQRYSFTNIVAIILLICFCSLVVSCSLIGDVHTAVPTQRDEKLAYEQEIMKVIEDGLRDHQEKIDISEFRCDYNILSEVISLAAFNDPLYSPCLSRYKTVWWLGVYIQYVIPDYTKMHIVEYIETEINKIIATMDSDMSELDKAIWINDYICKNYEYDTTLTKDNTYKMLKTGYGTCRAYMQMFNLLADKAGLETSFAISYEMRHGWSIVQIDGYWYNIDVTWNDQLQGYCYLSSDETMVDFHCGMRDAVDIQFVECNNKRYDEVKLSRKEDEDYD